MHEYHAGDKADALAVPRVTVGHSVSMEHPPQCGLTTLLLRVGKVRMGGKRTTCVWEEIIHHKESHVPVALFFFFDGTQDHMH